MKKKLVSLILASAMLFGMVGCSSDDEGTTSSNSGKRETLTVWSFTDEMDTIVNDYYLIENPDLPYDIEVVVTPTEQYQSRLDGVLATDTDVPDVILLEQQFALKYLESDYLMSFESDGLDLADAARETNYAYTISFMEKDGANYGLAWQASPGAFYYRRSIAEEILGSDDPEVVQEAVSTWEAFDELAIELAQNDYKIMSSITGASKPQLASRTEGWIVENTLVIDDQVYDYLEQLYFLQNEEDLYGVDTPLINESTVWQDAWFSDIYGDTVFGYFLPSWGLHYVLEPSSESSDGTYSSYGDWGVVEGPQAYFDGGTWMSVYSGTDMADEAKALIEYVTLDAGFSEAWAMNTGDFVANMDVIDSIKSEVTSEFLGGQDQYEIFDTLAKEIDTSIVTGYDMDILSILDSQAISYATQTNDILTTEDVITNFKIAMQNTFPTLVIE